MHTQTHDIFLKGKLLLTFSHQADIRGLWAHGHFGKWSDDHSNGI